jgi:hypothetical protein
MRHDQRRHFTPHVDGKAQGRPLHRSCRDSLRHWSNLWIGQRPPDLGRMSAHGNFVRDYLRRGRKTTSAQSRILPTQWPCYFTPHVGRKTRGRSLHRSCRYRLRRWSTGVTTFREPSYEHLPTAGRRFKVWARYIPQTHQILRLRQRLCLVNAHISLESPMN